MFIFNKSDLLPLTYMNFPRSQNPSRPTWGIASLRQTTDFTPGYIAERSCREELLDLSGVVDSDNVLFLEAGLEVTTSARVVLDKQ
jgi:hypothetical protein